MSAAPKLAPPAWFVALTHNGLPTAVRDPNIVEAPLFALMTSGQPTTLTVRFYEASEAFYEVWTNERDEADRRRPFQRWTPAELAVLVVAAESGDLDGKGHLDLRDVKAFQKRRVRPEDYWLGDIPAEEWRAERDGCEATLGQVLAAIGAELVGARVEGSL